MIKVPSKTDFTTNLTANEFNGIVVETANIIDFTQISPSGAFNTGSDNQIDQAIKFYAQTNRFFAATGSANAITLSTPAPRNPQKAYYGYMEIAFIAPFSNTNACTINIDGLGVKSLKNLANADLVAGNIVAGDLITAFYNGTSFLTKITPRPTSIVKFAVNDASQDAITAEPNFITATGAKQITVNGSVVPIQGTYYDGSGFIISNSQVFDTSALNLATARIVIVEEGVLNFNVLGSIITESHLPPSGGVDGNYWIQTNPLKTYKRIGGVWELTRFVKLGEYPTSTAGIVGTVRCYCFNRKAFISQNLTSSLVNTFQDFSHNIGTSKINVISVRQRITTAYYIYAVGEYAEIHAQYLEPNQFRAWTSACYKIKNANVLSIIGGNRGLGIISGYTGNCSDLNINNGPIEIEIESTY